MAERIDSYGIEEAFRAVLDEAVVVGVMSDGMARLLGLIGSGLHERGNERSAPGDERAGYTSAVLAALDGTDWGAIERRMTALLMPAATPGVTRALTAGDLGFAAFLSKQVIAAQHALHVYPGGVWHKLPDGRVVDTHYHVYQWYRDQVGM